MSCIVERESFTKLIEQKDDLISSLRKELTDLLKFKKETAVKAIEFSSLNERYRLRESELFQRLGNKFNKYEIWYIFAKEKI